MELPREVRLARTLRNSVESQVACDVADELDAVGEYSASYPFLALSRRIGADYGDVLWFADFLRGGARLRNVHVHGALERLTERQKTWIMGRVDNLRVEREREEDQR